MARVPAFAFTIALLAIPAAADTLSFGPTVITTRSNREIGGFFTGPRTASNGENFLVVWTQISQSGPPFSLILHSRLVGGDGRVLGRELEIPSNVPFDAFAVIATSSGNYVVVWIDTPSLVTHAGTRILAQRIDRRNGSKLGKSTVISEASSTQRHYLSAMPRADDGFLIVWCDDGVASLPDRYEGEGQIMSLRIDKNNHPIAPALTTGTYSVFNYCFGRCPTGRVALLNLAQGTWVLLTFNSGYHAETRSELTVFAPDGSEVNRSSLPIGWSALTTTSQPELLTVVSGFSHPPEALSVHLDGRIEAQVRLYQSNAGLPAAAFSRGRILVSWSETNSTHTSSSIRARLLDSVGQHTLTRVFQLARGDSDDLGFWEVSSPDMAVNGLGQFLITWKQEGKDGSHQVAHRIVQVRQ